MLNWLPENVASYGGDVDSLMYTIYYVVGFWFVLAEGVLGYFVIRSWWSGSNEDVPYVKGNTFYAALWVLVPAALVLACDLGIDFYGTPVWERVKSHRPEARLNVKIVGQQFSWIFVHPGADGELGTDDDIRTRNRLHVPARRNITFTLTSRDVVHSFWVPALRLKQDAVPGRTISGWFHAEESGTYPLACAELCGVGHGVMDGELIVHEPDSYRRWVTEQS